MEVKIKRSHNDCKSNVCARSLRFSLPCALFLKRIATASSHCGPVFRPARGVDRGSVSSNDRPTNRSCTYRIDLHASVWRRRPAYFHHFVIEVDHDLLQPASVIAGHDNSHGHARLRLLDVIIVDEPQWVPRMQHPPS